MVIENGTMPNDDLYFALKPGSTNLGEIDLELTVDLARAGRSDSLDDTVDYERIHHQHLTKLPGVARVKSSFTLRTVAKKTELPLA